MKKVNKINKWISVSAILAGVTLILLHFYGPHLDGWSLVVGPGILLIGGIGLGDSFTIRGVAVDIKDLPKGLRLRVISVLSDGRSMIAHEIDDKEKSISEPYFIREVTLPHRLASGSICFVNGTHGDIKWISDY